MASDRPSMREAKQIVKALESGEFMVECPCCSEPMRLKDAGLFYLDDFTEDAAELYEKCLAENKDRRKELRKKRNLISTRSEITTESVNIGKILERLCPSFASFNFDKNDCRSLFDPIDYVIFEGLAASGKVSRIIFSEIKTGKARLQPKQKQIKSLVEDRQVEFDIYRPER